jgi:uncharacterized phage protein gp47/JayE
MAYERPTLSAINTRIIGDIEASLGQTTPILPRAVLRVLARVFAASIHSNYGFLDWVSKQLFPDTAETEYLDRWASIWGVTRKAPSFASGSITITGTDGSILPSGSHFIDTNENEYEATAGATIVSGTATVTVESISSGVIGDLAEGNSVSLAEPVSGIDSDALVAAGGISGGADVEDDEDLRVRILARIQTPPQGGTASDYIDWALTIPGITRAWANEAYMGPGTVGVVIVSDDAPSIIPGAPLIAEVAAYIETLRPLCATVYVMAPTLVTMNFTINLEPNTAAVQAAVQTALTAFIKANSGPGSTVTPSQISEVISGAAGEISHVLVSPVSDTIMANDQIGIMGTITWQ